MSEKVLNLLLTLLMLAIPLVAWQIDEPYIITLATKVCILSLAGVGLNLVLGYGGLISLGHATFFGVGGYTMGVLASHAQNFTPLMQSPWLVEGTKSMPLIWLLAMIICAVVALIVGLLSLRTTGVYFIMVTLAFGQMFYYFTISWPAYGGEDGLSIYVRNSFPGLNTLDPIQFFAICFFLLLVVLFLMARLNASAFGLALNSARQNTDRVLTVGISVFKVRLIAFCLSGTITGLAGALFADLNRFVSPTMFSWQTSGEIMVFVILGGVARLYGPVAGAAIFMLLEHFLGELSEYWHIYLGVILLLVVLFAKGGVIGLLSKKSVQHV